MNDTIKLPEVHRHGDVRRGVDATDAKITGGRRFGYMRPQRG